MMGFDRLGVWTFYGGLLVAIIAAFVSSGGIGPATAMLIGFLGIVVGLINVRAKEVHLFLLASIAFIVGASALSAILSAIPGFGYLIPIFLQAVIIFVAPGAAIVALKVIYTIDRKK